MRIYVAVIVLVTGERCVKNCSLPAVAITHRISFYNFNHPHLWFSETYMKGRRNNRLSGNRNSPFVGRLCNVLAHSTNISITTFILLQSSNISLAVECWLTSRMSYCYWCSCQKWKQEWALAIREYRLVERHVLWDKILSGISERKEKKNKRDK